MIQDEVQKEYIELIKSSGRSLLTLINGILDLSKIEAGKLELHLEFVNSQSFFSDFERIFSLRLSEKGLKFFLEISSSTPAGIYIDDARMRQIILNLIGNAIKFTQKGSIKLIVYSENPQILNYPDGKAEELIDLIIEVKDTGIGISKAMQEEVFNPFIQGKEQNIKKYGGTGLGLTITKRLVQLMNGTIDLSSRLNKGSLFKIKIPGVSYLKDFEEHIEENQLNPAEILFKKAVILIADDLENNRKYLRDVLKNTNLIIVEAENGKTALSLAKKMVPDLIITDIRMPVMDGFEFLDKLKNNEILKHIPVIAYSASVMKEQKDHILESKFAGLLIKPVLVKELYLELIRHLPFNKIKDSGTDKILPEIKHVKEISDLPGLIHILDTRIKDIWKTFEIMQPIGEVRDFGRECINLGNNFNSSVVVKYGEGLVNAADSFNIEVIIKLLKKFNGMIEGLKNSNQNNNNV